MLLFFRLRVFFVFALIKYNLPCFSLQGGKSPSALLRSTRKTLRRRGKSFFPLLLFSSSLSRNGDGGRGDVDFGIFIGKWVDSLSPRCYSYHQVRHNAVSFSVFPAPSGAEGTGEAGEFADRRRPAGEFGEIREESDCAASGTGQKRLRNSWEVPFRRIWPHVHYIHSAFVRLSEEKSEEERERGKI